MQDQIQEAEFAGSSTVALNGVNDLLLPIVKGVSSERAYEQLAQSLQTFGGSGYLQDYPVEQYIRDAKIDSLYEGTTAIQAQDFFFRKIVRDKGVALRTVTTEILDFCESISAEGRLKVDRELLVGAVDDVSAMVTPMTDDLRSTEEDPRNIYKVGLNGVRLLLSVGDLMIGYLLLRQASIALTRLDGADGAAGSVGSAASAASAADQAYYEGKVAVAHFFAETVLPELRARRQVTEHVDLSVMNVAESAF